MEKKNDYTIYLLVAAGLGLYWYMKNKSTNTNTVTPPTDGGKSTNPVYNEPAKGMPVYEDLDPIDFSKKVYKPTVETYTPATDFFNSVTTLMSNTDGGNINNDRMESYDITKKYSYDTYIE